MFKWVTGLDGLNQRLNSISLPQISMKHASALLYKSFICLTLLIAVSNFKTLKRPTQIFIFTDWLISLIFQVKSATVVSLMLVSLLYFVCNTWVLYRFPIYIYIYNMVAKFTCKFCFMSYLHTGQIMNQHFWPSYLYQSITIVMSYIGVYGAFLKKKWALIWVNAQTYIFSINYFPYTVSV